MSQIVALRILAVALTVGEKGVALKVGEKGVALKVGETAASHLKPSTRRKVLEGPLKLIYVYKWYS